MWYILQRIFQLIAVLIVSSFIVFGGLYLAPGNPESFLVQGRSVTPDVLASIREQFGLDKPFLARYWDWIVGILQGDFGRSLTNRQDVGEMLASRLETSIWLVLYAAALIVLIGVGLGMLAGRFGGKLDALILWLTSFGVAVPTFFAALILMLLLSVGAGWFPVFGSGSGGSALDRLHHLTLPAIALALPAAATVARVTRTSIFAEKHSEHALFAISRGIDSNIVYGRHVVRNALLPVITVVGTNLAGLIAGAFVVEYAFSLDGLGSLLIEGVQRKDFAIVQAVSLILVAVFGVVNLIVDLSYSIIDPRVRLKGAN